jgi:MYXO-CTERM domain-containing protein
MGPPRHQRGTIHSRDDEQPIVPFAARSGSTARCLAHVALSPTEAWQFDVNATVVSSELLTRPYLRVIGDELYVGAHEHIFEVDPLDGSLKRQWDLVALTGLAWEVEFEQPGFFSGGLDIGTFSRDAETLIIGFERRIVALDRVDGALLWHTDPGTFPGRQHPLNHSGIVYVLSERHSLPAADAGPNADASADDEVSGCGCRAAGNATSSGPPAFALALLARIRVARRRRGRS